MVNIGIFPINYSNMFESLLLQDVFPSTIGLFVCLGHFTSFGLVSVMNFWREVCKHLSK